MWTRLVGPAGLLALAAGGAPSPAAGQGRVVTVRMVDGGPYGMTFAPVRVTAAPGDTLRFVQSGRAPHNVEFRSAPAGVTLGEWAKGPLVTAAGATHDVVLDARFRPGRYVYVCTPHEVLGMAGIVTVKAPDPGGRK